MHVYKIYTIIQGCYNNIYKVNKLTVQGKYTNCIRSVQDCHLWRILVDFKQFFFLVIQELHTLLLQIPSFHALYLTRI